MTKTSGGPAIDRDGVSTPAQEERDREPGGNRGGSGGKPSPGGGETSTGEEAPIDLGTAHDRAS